MTLSRRQFTQSALGSLLTLSLLDLVAARGALADDARPDVEKWLRDVADLCRDVKGQKIKQTDWQAKIEELYGKVDVNDLLKLIDFDKLAAGVELPDNGAKSLRVPFPKIEGLPETLAFGRQIFAMKKGRSVVPHGHNNMATAFLILKGEFHGRHYDRVKDEPQHMIVKPTIDRKFAVGECSTISDFKDNVHWFRAQSETGFIYNIHVMDVQPGGKLASARVYMDPAGEKLEGGLIRARLIDYKEAHKLYG
ncbi:MAG: hypothetical protein HYS13_23105 [Planctomycetia bacterium]|nr:hypothetical protein [Planctomycetia bacterium]